MNQKLHDVPYEPVNVNEHLLYAMAIRLDALCHMMSSLMEHIAKKEGVAVTEVKEEIVKTESVEAEPVVKKKRTTKK